MTVDDQTVTANASIRGSDEGITACLADALEQALLLPEDMGELRRMRDQNVFMILKKELAMAIQSAHRAEEITANSYKSLRAGKVRLDHTQRILELKEKKLQEVSANLNKTESERSGLEAPLKTTERQAEDQRLQLRQADENFAAAKKLIEGLKQDLKKVEEAKQEAIKAKEEAIAKAQEADEAVNQAE